MALVTSAMNRDHATIYDQAATLDSLVTQPDFPDKDLASAISALLSAFIGRREFACELVLLDSTFIVDHLRQRTFALLSKAYLSLPLPLACAYTALPPEQVITSKQQSILSSSIADRVVFSRGRAIVVVRPFDPDPDAEVGCQSRFADRTGCFA